MSQSPEMKRFISALYPLNRSICSPDFDKALSILRRDFIPDLHIDAYRTSSDAWTWIIPQKWALNKGYIKCGGRYLIHTDDEPLSVWSGSKPFHGRISHERLMRHVYSDPSDPELIRWYFRYYGNLDWGFNLPHGLVEKLDPDAEYEVRIDSKYYEDELRVGHVLLRGKSAKTIVIISDLCHPYQCNDSLSGAAVNYLLLEHLRQRDTFFSYLFLFVPETIGTVAFFANNEILIQDILYSFYGEFWGRDLKLNFQKSLHGNTLMDRNIMQVLSERYGHGQFTVRKFRRGGVKNDEMVMACPPISAPSFAFNRRNDDGIFFPEYHSNQDTPAHLDYDKMQDAYELLREILDRFDKQEEIPAKCEKVFRCPPIPNSKRPKTDFIPIPKFKGTIFLTRYGLWVDWRVNPKLNAALDEITACLNGENSVAEIAAFVDVSYDCVYDYMLGFEQQGLIEKRKGGMG